MSRTTIARAEVAVGEIAPADAATSTRRGAQAIGRAPYAARPSLPHVGGKQGSRNRRNLANVRNGVKRHSSSLPGRHHSQCLRARWRSPSSHALAAPGRAPNRLA